MGQVGIMLFELVLFGCLTLIKKNLQSEVTTVSTGSEQRSASAYVRGYCVRVVKARVCLCGIIPENKFPVFFFSHF